MSELSEQSKKSEPSGSETALPAKGTRAPFRDIPSQLTPEDMTHPGTQKLVLEMLARAEEEKEEYKTRCTSISAAFHQADKELGILQQKSKSYTTIDILYSTGITLAGLIVGLAPVFWESKLRGILALLVGGALFTISVAARIFFK